MAIDCESCVSGRSDENPLVASFVRGKEKPGFAKLCLCDMAKVRSDHNGISRRYDLYIKYRHIVKHSEYLLGVSPVAFDSVREYDTFAGFLSVEHKVNANGIVVNTNGIIGKNPLLCHVPS